MDTQTASQQWEAVSLNICTENPKKTFKLMKPITQQCAKLLDFPIWKQQIVNLHN